MADVTPNYEFPLLEDMIPSWLESWNGTMKSLDTIIHDISKMVNKVENVLENQIFINMLPSNLTLPAPVSRHIFTLTASSLQPITQYKWQFKLSTESNWSNMIMTDDGMGGVFSTSASGVVYNIRCIVYTAQSYLTSQVFNLTVT